MHPDRLHIRALSAGSTPAVFETDDTPATVAVMALLHSINRRTTLALCSAVATLALSNTTEARSPRPHRRHLAEMLVLAPDAYADALKPLLVWKHRSGVPADLHLLSDFGDSVDEVQAWLRELSLFLPREYILIVGDVDTIPSPTIEDATGYRAASDYAYTDLDEDGELGDAAIGRFPARDRADVEAFVARILAYEREFGRDSSQSLEFLGRSMGIANDDASLDVSHQQRVEDALVSLAVLGAEESRIFVEGVDNWAAADVTGSLTAGVGHIVALTDATGEGWLHSDAPVFEMHADDILDLEHGGAWPVVYDLGGPNGRMGTSETSMAHAWSWAGTPDPDRGAMAVVAWSGTGLAEISGTLPEAIAAALADGEWRLGPALQRAREGLDDNDPQAKHLAQSLLTLFGDPSLMLRHAPPQRIEVEHARQVELSDPVLEVSVTDERGRPVPGALVTTSFRDHYTEKMTTDADGRTSLWTLTTGVEAGSIVHIVVSGPHVVSYEGTVEITDTNGTGSSSESDSNDGGTESSGTGDSNSTDNSGGGQSESSETSSGDSGGTQGTASSEEGSSDSTAAEGLEDRSSESTDASGCHASTSLSPTLRGLLGVLR